MSARLVVNELAVEAARVALLDAHSVLTHRALRKPVVTVQTLGDAGAELSAFVSGLDTACSVLGDSARAGSLQLSVLQFASDELDRHACVVPNDEAGNSNDSGNQ